MGPFFHVGMWFSDTRDPDLLRTDLSEKALRSGILKDYRAGRRITENGTNFDLSKVVKIKISSTGAQAADVIKQEDEQAELARMKFNRSSNWVTMIGLPTSELRDILEYGENVTDQFITAPPGSGFSIIEILNHNWVITIIGGLVVALIVALVIGGG
jgi:hypothetical protein